MIDHIPYGLRFTTDDKSVSQVSAYETYEAARCCARVHERLGGAAEVWRREVDIEGVVATIFFLICKGVAK